MISVMPGGLGAFWGWNHPVSYHYVLANKVFENTGGRIRTSKITKVLDDGVVVFNGTVRKLDHDVWPSVKGSNYFYKTKEGYWYLNGKFITGKEIHEPHVNDRGDYAYTVYGEHAHISQGKNDSKPYVVIDGQRFGKAPAFECSYDESKRVFRWYSVENQEVAAYEYALD